MGINPFLCSDGYKVSHHMMYPKGTLSVYSNFTPRSNKHAPTGCDKVVSFGQQMVMRQIHDYFKYYFFNEPKEEVLAEIKKEYSMYLGYDYDVSHIEALHELQYLPITVKAIPEGMLVPIGVPVLTIWNTKHEFFWLTNFLETLISNLLWKPITSATIAYQYRKNLLKWAEKTDEKNIGAVEFQAHDFSMRGLSGVDSVISSGLGHATSFLGSDSLPVISGARRYYDEEGFVVGSVNATEHSVMSAGDKENELETFEYLMDQFPTGILSIVSDTWDLWKVLTVYLPKLKERILKRDGKIVIRPDSGDPVDIICGTEWGGASPRAGKTNEGLGVIELLWDTFGGTVNEQGYRVLDPHIGAIYGDSITIDRAEEICARLEAKGFASTNIVLGIGSYTYQMNTRDTFGFAMKATYAEVAVGDTVEGREIFKDPVTDDGTKKSAKGLLMVQQNDINGELELIDQVSDSEEDRGYLTEIYFNGRFSNQTTLTEIRAKLR